MEDTLALKLIANEARGLVLDMVAKANSGHLGMPLGCADCMAVLFGYFLRYLPKNPRWINRDRFILSSGHGSALLYTYLHLSGFDVFLEDLQQFRQLKSKTPGHPEFGITPGVEATTGPLGQGIGNAVGIAVSQKKLADECNTNGQTILDNRIVCLCGDGCLQEGVGQESIALAGLWRLDNLILIYDKNNITLDGSADLSQCEDIKKKFEALNWHVVKVDGHNCEEIAGALDICREFKGKPSLIILNTNIGYGLDIAGTSKAHGASGIKEIKQAKERLGLDPEKSFFVSEKTKHFFEKRQNQLQKNYNLWYKNFEYWCKAQPEKSVSLIKKPALKDVFWENLPAIKEPIATRTACGKLLNHLAHALPRIITGSADLFESVKNYIENGGNFSADNLSGRNIYFGIREHAMGAILNGMAYDGFYRVSGSTFFSFSDYLKPALRVAALSHLPVWYFFSHDSIAVGEDGPTHQPIEQLAGLRAIPNVKVFRPADYDELMGCFKQAEHHADGPSIFILSRQNLVPIESLTPKEKLEGVSLGAYIVHQEKTTLDYILMATGSEVELALKTAELLGDSTRIVSVPSMELFIRQNENYQSSILPPNCHKRVAIEAGSPQSWYQWVGLNGLVIGMNSFGLSAPAKQAYQYFEFSPEAIAEKIKQKFG